MIKRILVPTDGSAYSCHAFAKAVEIAKIFKADIELLHVVTQPPVAMHELRIDDYYPISKEKVDDIGAKVCSMTLGALDTSSIKIIKKVVPGYPASEILDEIRRDFDLVIMGTRGHRPIVGALIGSVTQRVIAEAECPVMVVK